MSCRMMSDMSDTSRVLPKFLAKEDEAVLLKEFRTYLKDDPVKTDLIDMTKLGLVEVTRKKIKKSLRDSLKMN